MSVKYSFHTTREIADILKLNNITIYGYIRSGELKAVKFGRTYRVESNELADFIKRHQTKK